MLGYQRGISLREIKAIRAVRRGRNPGSRRGNISIRRRFSVQSLASLEYWVAQTSETVIASEAKQSILLCGAMDCFRLRSLSFGGLGCVDNYLSQSRVAAIAT